MKIEYECVVCVDRFGVKERHRVGDEDGMFVRHLGFAAGSADHRHFLAAVATAALLVGPYMCVVLRFRFACGGATRGCGERAMREAHVTTEGAYCKYCCPACRALAEAGLLTRAVA